MFISVSGNAAHPEIIVHLNPRDQNRWALLLADLQFIGGLAVLDQRPNQLEVIYGIIIPRKEKLVSLIGFLNLGFLNEWKFFP